MITAKTTLGDLALLRAQYGVINLQVETRDGRCVVTLQTFDHRVRGTSRKDSVLPEVDALDDAFTRLCHLVGASIAVDGARTGESSKWAL